MEIKQTPRGICTKFILELPQGLHARPSAKFAQLAQSFKSDIVLINENGEVNAKSMLDVLSLGVKKGQEVLLLANGSDAEKALKSLSEFGRMQREPHGQIPA